MNQRKAINAPIIEEPNIANSPANFIFGTSKYALKIACPEIYTIIDKVKNEIIEGTVANPSSPSVKFTALDVETITNIQKTIE